jgi:hypothetical protein
VKARTYTPPIDGLDGGSHGALPCKAMLSQAHVRGTGGGRGVVCPGVDVGMRSRTGGGYEVGMVR